MERSLRDNLSSERFPSVSYADGTRDSAGNIILFSAMFYPQAPAGQQLKPISDPEEQERVNWIIKDMRDSIGDQLNALPF